MTSALDRWNPLTPLAAAVAMVLAAFAGPQPYAPVLVLAVALLVAIASGIGFKVTALTALGYSREKIRVLVNRSRKGTAIALEDVTETLRRDVFMAIPNSFDAVGASVDQGVPIFKLAPRDPVARALREIAATLVESKKEEGGWLRNVLSRR